MCFLFTPRFPRQASVGNLPVKMFVLRQSFGVGKEKVQDLGWSPGARGVSRVETKRNQVETKLIMSVILMKRGSCGKFRTEKFRNKTKARLRAVERNLLRDPGGVLGNWSCSSVQNV